METLVAVPKKFVAPGTIIHSDCWKAYSGLKEEGYEHFTVNHSETFVDPDTGAHSNSVEGMWQKLKHGVHMPMFRNVREHHLPGYLAMFIWREKRTNDDLFTTFLADSAKVYSGNCSEATCAHCLLH